MYAPFKEIKRHEIKKNAEVKKKNIDGLNVSKSLYETNANAFETEKDAFDSVARADFLTF